MSFFQLTVVKCSDRADDGGNVLHRFWEVFIGVGNFIRINLCCLNDIVCNYAPLSVQTNKMQSCDVKCGKEILTSKWFNVRVAIPESFDENGDKPRDSFILLL